MFVQTRKKARACNHCLRIIFEKIVDIFGNATIFGYLYTWIPHLFITIHKESIFVKKDPVYWKKLQFWALLWNKGFCEHFSTLEISLRTKINFFCVCCRRNHCIFYGSLHILSILYPVVGSILYYSNHISDKNFHKNCSECILSILIDFATWLWYFWKTNHLLKLFPSKLKHYISFSSTSAATITATYTPLS